MRKGLCLFASFALGTFTAIYLLPGSWWLWTGLALTAPAGFLAWKNRRLTALVCLGLAASFLWSAAYRAILVSPAEELNGRRTQVTFVVAEEPEGPVICYLTLPGRLPVKAQVTGSDDLEVLRPGDRFTVTADCAFADRVRNSPTQTYTAKGIFLLARTRSGVEVEKAQSLPWWSLPKVWSHRLGQALQAALPADVSGFLTALVTGDRDGLDQELTLALSRTGTSHIVAVSGMHLCFLVGFLSQISGNNRRRQGLLCFPVILFALMVDTASVWRAALMLLCVLLAPAFGREGDRLTSLSFALAVLLVMNPYSIAGIGLQLSFAASLGLTLVTEPLKEFFSRRRFKERQVWWVKGANKALALLSGVLSAGLGALAFSLPLSLAYFGTVSLISPLVNLLILPVVSILFEGALAVGVTALLAPAAANFLGSILAWPARGVLGVIRLGAKVPFAALSLTEIYLPLFLLGVYALALVVALWKGQRRRLWLFAIDLAVLLAGTLLFTRLSFYAGDLTVAALDVGQGLSVALTSGGKTALIDCGGNQRKSAGDIAADFLADRGETHLDLLVLTHFHADHVNGLPALFRRMEIAELVIPQVERQEEEQAWVLELAQEEGCKITWLTENTTRSLGEAQLRLYAPLGDGDANEEGLSVLASAGDFKVLLTGDMNDIVEKRLVKYGNLPRCTLLVAGHHGSADATGDTLLEAIRPETALISVGENTYGHPHKATLDRLESRGIAVYRTDRSGAITVTANR